ncbi:MAG: formylglycine-generating enzyme family protein [Symploca sp. SIO2G7]|nr:formylglycine-generating enzyme family protein [Symploca sp. SIO2G7]
MVLDGKMAEKIIKAIKDAFRLKDFKRMLYYKLNITEADIHSDEKYEDVIFEVVKDLARQNRIKELINAATETNSGNDKLKQVAKEYEIYLKSQPKPLENEINATQSSSQLQAFGFQLATVQINKKKELLDQNQSEIIITYRPGRARFCVEDLVYGVTLEMVAIPAGTFRMGSPKNEKESQEYERPQHQVAIQPFFMGKYLITQKQWEKVAAFVPQVNYELNPNPSRFAGDNQPVEQVSWYEAVEFCDRLSRYTGKQYRLPSEAEWEYACRAGETTPFYFGETITTDLANYNGAYTYSNAPNGEYRRKTTPVGSFPPNIFGLYDMHGNLWEWCADTWHGNYQGASKDGSPWLGNDNHQRRLLRGGSWYSPPEGCRSGYRYKYDPNQGNDRISFRVVCDVMPKP